MTFLFVSIILIIVIITDKDFMESRYSKQREEIYSVLKNTVTHPTAEWIYEQVRKLDPTVSLGTVYRNLAKLKDCGQIIALDTADNKRHYDACIKPHGHFVCECCQKVFDVWEMPDLPEELEENGYLTKKTNIVYYGICRECNKK